MINPFTIICIVAKQCISEKRLISQPLEFFNKYQCLIIVNAEGTFSKFGSKKRRKLVAQYRYVNTKLMT